jgi:hypothetical protein
MQSRNDILKLVQEETDKTNKKSLVPKIVYGKDKNGNNFVYFKMKNFNTGSYESDSFVLLYQNPKGVEADVEQRQDDIINWFMNEYETGEPREFGENGQVRRHFFIKGKLFRTRAKMDKFYINSIKKLLVTLSNIVILWMA